MDSKPKLANALEFKFTAPEVLQVYLRNLPAFREHSALEVSLFLYPYSSKLTADHYRALPYEDYLVDLNAGVRTAYKVAGKFGGKLFGLLLGLLIVLLFWRIDPGDIISIQSIVSILGAYAIGKELWDDIDNFLANTFNASERLRWRETPYFYVKNHFGTVEKFWEKARNDRYASNTALPSKFDFIAHSNHKTLELLFKPQDLEFADYEALRIGNFRFVEKQKPRPADFMLGFKLTLIKNYFFFKREVELFQLLDKGNLGVVENDTWHAGALLARNTITIGRWKFYMDKRTVPDYTLGELPTIA
jgi:hypothetical protein